MKAGSFYQHAHMRGVYVLVEAILKKDTEKTTYRVKWYRKDDKTKKLMDMDTEQDMVVPVDENKMWVMVSSN